MGWLTHHHSRSQIGQLLVKKKLISEEQLASAIERQRGTGQRLGDILAEWNLVTHRHVREALRRQRSARMAAAIVTAMLAPLESRAVEALPAGAASACMRPLDEEQLRGIAAQGLHEQLLLQVSGQDRRRGLEVRGDVAKLLHPMLGFLEADVSMKDVVYDPAQAAASVGKDGSLTLRLPSSIGEISFQNIRVRGADGPSFGSIAIKGIDLSGTTITLAPKR
ncbi:hypothetical protein [Janthinobacterium fluminis]|uniref:Uncharacterized protein n=1 Tax=Janthinobacterium fluminis TaxID=2987524 RepID=A0ABT5JX89_9BURK|nr:hypothetical protein [Janthinobacterium fluminis]MDC8757338.1 hypothetical protein [Janthinobacterium fluminis]